MNTGKDEQRIKRISPEFVMPSFIFQSRWKSLRNQQLHYPEIKKKRNPGSAWTPSTTLILLPPQFAKKP